jgi:uncharacterized protein (DUF362 family)
VNTSIRKHNEMNRRTFFKNLLSGIFLVKAFPLLGKKKKRPFFLTKYKAASNRRKEQNLIGRVVMAKDLNIPSLEANLRSKRVKEMILEGVKQLLGAPSIPAAWKSIFSPSDFVGIKLSCLAGRMLSPHPEVVDGIVAGLRLAGVKDENILIWERTNRELIRAGFTINTSKKGVKCFGSDALEMPYDATIQFAGSVGSCFSTILSTYCTALINVPVIKDHDLAGVTLAMKNLFGVIHNPNRYHDNNCDPYVADLSTHPYIKDKQRLVVCDGLLAQCHGGPSYKQQWAWNFSGLIISQDEVAADAIGADIIEKKRKEMNLKPLKEEGRPPKYIATAARLGLGENRLDKIKLIKI